MDQKLKRVISLNNKTSDNVRIALLIEYNGKSLVGWQKQNNGISVQGELEKCAKILFKIPRQNKKIIKETNLKGFCRKLKYELIL